MKKWLLMIVILVFNSGINADLVGDRSAFPIYVRVLRPYQPRRIIYRPAPQVLLPLPQESNPQEQLPRPQLTENEANAIQNRIAQKIEESRIAGYSHMYGASEYGYTDQYPR